MARDEQEAVNEALGAPYGRTSWDLPPGTRPSAGAPTSAVDGDGGAPSAETDVVEDEGGRAAMGEQTGGDAWLIQRAQEIYRASTDYLDANITTIWETNLSHFNNEHAPGTSFRKRNFKRSQIFRPKTRANIKNQEANLAAAAFSTQDLVDIQAEDKTSPVQVVSAKINKSLLQHRLKKKVPWFLTVLGAYQDTKNYGVCITHQYWAYAEESQVIPATNDDGSLVLDIDEQGNEIPMGYDETVVLEDDLCSDNIAPENFRFDPMCDWRDPATTSPYLVYLIPMYANEVIEMMDNIDEKTGRPQWRRYPLSAILSTKKEDYNRTKQAREGRRRIDPADEQVGNGYTTVWPHMNIIKVKGIDMFYYTLGTELVLTEMIPLAEAFPHLRRGQRPFTIGFSNIETHKNYPAGDNELGSGLQTEINDIANQRLDNVKLALNKRYYVRRGAQVDLDALVRNVPGGGVMMNDPEKDIKTVETRDVTGSSYKEQELLSVEMDELLGGFGMASRSSSGGGEGKVGNLAQAQQSAGAVQDYTIRLFMETWLEPTLRQMVQLIQMYETDTALMGLAAKESGVWERYGIDEITDEMLQQELTTTVDIGIGNTDPVRRVEKLIFGVTKTAELPGMAERMKSQEVSDEIFGAMGYKDASRFFQTEEEWAEEQAGKEPPPPPPEIMVKLEELKIRKEDNQMRDKREMAKLEMMREFETTKLGQDRELKLSDIDGRTASDVAKNQTARDVAATKELNKSQEISMKREQEVPSNAES